MRTFRVIVALGIVLAMTACGSSNTPVAGSDDAIHGGTVTYAEIGVQPTWIWPFIPGAEYSVTNTQVFQWLMYRPLYMFGDDGDSTTVNYALSPASAPVYSDGGRTVVINLKGWKWSDGETVDAQDVVFWLNMMRAEKDNYAGYAPGLLPDNLVSYAATGTDQVTLHLNGGYSSYWFTYNQLAEITPMPEAWDVTSLSGKPGSGGCAVSVAGCAAVYKFLSGQAGKSATYATSPLWRTVDGPWRLSSVGAAGTETFVPNHAYSGTPKPQLSEFKLVSYPNDLSAYAALKAGQVSVSAVAEEKLAPRAAGSPLPAVNPFGSGYALQPVYTFSIDYYAPNFNNPTMGAVFRQLYVRQALQEAEDQPGIDAQAYHGYAVPDSGPVPPVPVTSWEPAVQEANGGQGPYPYSLAAATSLLTSHGWQESGGVMRCQRPGVGTGECGAGIAHGQELAFTLDWAIGITSVPQMMAVYKADAARIGIRITMVGQPYNTILQYGPCSGTGPACRWQAAYYGDWVFNGPGFEPTGEALFESGAPVNTGSYSNPIEDNLITATHTSNSLAVFHQYATYTAEQLPVIWMPDSYVVWAVKSTLHDVHLSPLYTVLPEFWYYTG